MTMTTQDRHETEKLLTPAEVAALFRVDPKTVTRWAKAGKLTSIRTLGAPWVGPDATASPRSGRSWAATDQTSRCQG